MYKKTLIMASKPSIAKELVKLLVDEFEERDGYFEGENYIVAICLFSIVADHISIPFRIEERESVDDALKRLNHTDYETIDATIRISDDPDWGDWDLNRFKLIESLVSRDDVEKIIWYACETAPYLSTYEFCYRNIACSGKKHQFCFDAFGPEGLYIPYMDLKSAKVMERYYEAARFSCLRESIISSYFTKAIDLIYTSKYGMDQNTGIDTLSDYDLFMLNIVYEKPNRFYSTGSLILEQSNRISDKLSPLLYQFPLFGSFDNSASAIEILDELGLINIKKTTQKIYHTEYGSRIYEIIKEFFPDLGNTKKFIYWRKRINKIIQGKISGEEYLSEVMEYVRTTLADINADHRL